MKGKFRVIVSYTFSVTGVRDIVHEECISLNVGPTGDVVVINNQGGCDIYEGFNVTGCRVELHN